MVKLGQSLLNLLLACDNSKYTWIFREREPGKTHLLLDLEEGPAIFVQPIDKDKNEAIIGISNTLKPWTTEELEKKLYTSPNYFTKIDDNKYLMKENVNSMLLDGIVDFFKDK